MNSAAGQAFRFDPETHTYWLGDKRIPGVSEIIQGAGLKKFDGIDPAVVARAADRGRAVHDACQFLDEGDLDWGTVSEEIVPRVRAWENFRADLPFEIAHMEEPMHSILGFGGKPDRVVVINGKRVLIDIKTYRPDAVTGVQLAAYGLLIPVAIRRAVWLKADGKYSVTDYTDYGDEAVFRGALIVHKFKESQK